MRFVFKALAIVLLSGCSLGKQNPTVDTMASYLPGPKESAICLFRQGVMPKDVSPRIYVDGIEVNKLPENSFFWIKTTPGNKWIEAKWSDLSGTADHTLPIVTRAGETHYVQLRASKPVPYAQGIAQPSELVQINGDFAHPLLKDLNEISAN